MLSRKVVSKVIPFVLQSQSILKSDKRKNRKKQLEFFAGELEKRQLLASFTFDSGTGLLAIETDSDNETLSIVSTSAFGNYTISSTSNFTGEDSPGNITGNTTGSLTIFGNSALTSIEITNNAANSGSSFYFGDSLGNGFINNLTVNFSNSSSGQITVANTTLFSNDAGVNLSTSGNSVMVLSNLSATGLGTLHLAGESVSVSGEISACSGVSITANALNVTGNISVSNGTVDIYSNNSIDLGTETSGKLSLTNVEANRIYGLGLTVFAPASTNVIISDEFNTQNVNDLTIDSPEISIEANLTAPKSLLLRTAALQINATTSTANISGDGIGIWAQAPIDLGSESPGNLSLTNSEIGLISTNALNIFTFTDTLTITGNISYGGNITLSSGLDLTESGSGCLSLAGSALVVSGGGSVTLSNPLNNFTTVGVTALDTIIINDVDSLILDRFSAGNLTINSNGRISQIGDTIVTGTANFIATGCITLDNPYNDFATITASGSDVVIVDRSVDGLTLGLISASNLTVTGLTGNITQSDAANVSSGTASFTACGVVTLDQANNFQTILANGTDVTIRDINSILLDVISAGNLTVNADGISQSASANVTSASNFVSASTILLDQASNDLGDVTSNGVLTLSNGVTRSLNPVGGNVTISGGTISSTTTTSVDLHQTDGILSGLIVINGTSNLSGGSFSGEANVTGGLLRSSVNIDTLVVGASGTANLIAGTVGAVTSTGTLNVFGASLGSLDTSGTSILTGGNVTGLTSVTGGNLESNVSLNNLTISAGSANLTGGSAATTDLQSGNLTSAATLGDLTVLNGIANLTSGSAQSLAQHGGTLSSSAIISGTADLSGGDTYIDSAGSVNGTTTLTGSGNLTSNGSLGAVFANSASSLANLTGGSAESLTNNGGTILSSANVTGNNTINSGTTTILNDGQVGGTTTVTPSGSSSSVLYSTGNLTTLNIGSNGTAHVSGGLVTGVVTLINGGRLNTSSAANLAGLIQVNGGTANLAGIQSGPLNINGASANVTLNSCVTGLTTVTLSNSTRINTNTGNLTIDGANANVAFGTGTYSIGATTVSANSGLTVPANTTLTSLTQSNGTVNVVGNVTGLSSLTGGTLNSNGVLGNLSVGGGFANQTGGSANVVSVISGNLVSAANLTSLNVTGGSASLTGGSISGTTASNGTLDIGIQIAGLTVNSGTTTVLSTGNVTGPVSAVGGNLTINSGGQLQGLTVIGSAVENHGTILNDVSVTGGCLTLLNGSTQDGNFTVSGTGTLTSNATIGGTLAVWAGTATIQAGGSVSGTSNVSGTGLITSNGTLAALDVLIGGTAIITGGSVAATTSAASLNVTGGTVASLQVSNGTSNILGGSVTNQVYVTGGSLVSNQSLGYLTVSGGSANLTGGSTSNLTQSGGTVISVANITGFANLTSGNTTINNGGIVGGTTTISGGNLTANASLQTLIVSSGTANLTGGSVGATTVNGTLTSAANLTSLDVQSAGTATITGGIVGVTTSANILNQSGGNLTSLTVTAGTSTLTAGQVDGLANATGGLLVSAVNLGSLTVGAAGTANISDGLVGTTMTSGRFNATGGTFDSIQSSNITNVNNATVTGLSNVTSGTFTANATLGDLSVALGATSNLTDGTANVVNSAGTLNSNAVLSSLAVSGGTSTLTTGSVTNLANVTGGLLVSAVSLGSLTVGNAGTANISTGTVGATNSSGTLNATGGTFASIESSNITNVNNATVTGLSNVTGGTFTANATLGALNVSAGTASLIGGTATNLIQSGGNLTSVANITGFASLTGGTTSINNGGLIGGTTTVNNGNLTSNGSLNDGLQLTAGIATLNGGTVNRTGNNSAIVVNNGTFTAHNSTIHGATGATANTPVVYISGGTVQLANDTLTPGNGARYLLFNNTTANVSAIGNTFNGVNSATANLSQLYDIVDQIIDGVDSPGLGQVVIKSGNVYVTKNSFFIPLGTTDADVQRGVDTASSGDTIHVKSGDYTVTNNANNGVVAVSQNLTISGAGTATTSVNAFVLNNGSNITTWSGISAISNVTIHSGAVINNATSTPTLLSLIESNGSLIFDSGASFAAQLNVVNKNLTITSNTPASTATINTIGSGSANTAISLSGTGNVTLTDLTLSGSGSALNATNTGSLTINRLALNAGLANLTTGVKGAITNTGSFIYNGQMASTNYTFNSTGMSTSTFNSQSLSLSPTGNVTINANLGNDTFIVNRVMSLTTLNGGDGDDSFSLGTTNPNASVTQINGNSGNNTLNGPVGRVNVFTFTSTGSGNLNTTPQTDFTGIQSISGGLTGSMVIVNRGAVVSSINGGGGIDTIQINSNAGDTVNMTISGTNTGNITGTGGTSVGVYTGISHLIGTAGNDTFKFIDNASLLTGSLNGGTGTNAINYTGTTKPTFVNLATGQATGVTTTTNTGVVSNIQDLFGGTGNDYFSGSSAANVMDGGSGNDTLLGLAGNDILVGNYGQDLINGGAGYDILIGGFINFVSTMPNATLQEGLQTVMTSWITVTTDLLFNSVSKTLNTASSSQYRLVGDTNLASTYLLQTVFNDQATDRLTDIASSTTPSWFFATERVTQGNDVVLAGTTFTVSKKTVTSKTGRTPR